MEKGVKLSYVGRTSRRRKLMMTLNAVRLNYGREIGGILAVYTGCKAYWAHSRADKLRVSKLRLVSGIYTAFGFGLYSRISSKSDDEHGIRHLERMDRVDP